MKLLKTAIASLCLSASAFTGMSIYNIAQSADAVDTVSPMNLANYPLYVGGESLPALVMVMMSKDHSMYYEAYNDMTDLNDDGKIEGFFRPDIKYDGLFESSICYTYLNDLFEMSHKAETKTTSDNKTVYYCKNEWSGNFLNYVTTSRMDLVKRILIGGQRGYTTNNNYINTVRTSDGFPILVRQWIPHDTHAWAKLFNPVDIKKYCPSSLNCDSSLFTPYSDSAFLLGNVQNRMFLMMFKKSGNEYVSEEGLKLASLTEFSNKPSSSERNSYEKAHMFVWNWLSRESGVGGGVGFYTDGNDYKTNVTKPDGTDQESVKIKKFEVQVENCHVDVDKGITSLDLGSRCKLYGSENYNTVGLLQDFSDTSSVDAYFGLITASWNRGSNGQSSAVLRSEISNLFYDINQTTGDFKENSVLGAINNLALHAENTSDNSGSTENDWRDCKIDGDHNKRIYQKGDCLDWGNPLTQLIALSHDYFNGKLETSSAKGTDKEVDGRVVRARLNVAQGGKTEINLTIPSVNSADSPYKKSDIYWCQVPVNLLLMDESISFDWNVDASYDTDISDGFKIINSGENIKDNNFIYGEKSGNGIAVDGETLPTLKKVDDLSKVRGVSSIEPHFEGSLKGAALAAKYYKSKLTPSGAPLSDNGKHSSIQNIVVSMASYLPQFTIYAGESNKKVLFIPICKSIQGTERSTKYFKNGSSVNVKFDKGENYTTSCSVGDVFYVNSTYNSQGKLNGIEFRVSYEDNEAGSDFDMDVGASYKVQASETSDIVEVTTTGYYSDGYSGQLLGFVIVGTDGVWQLKVDSNNDGYPYEKHNVASGKPFDKDSFIHNSTATVYFDINKGQRYNDNDLSQSSSLYARDPFYEANYVGGDEVVSSELVKNSITQNAIKDPEDGNGRRCYTDATFNSQPLFYNQHERTDISKYPALPRVGASNGGVNIYCESSVTRKFKASDANGNFLESPLYYTAKYGYKNQSLSNYYYVTNASTLADNITQAMEAAVASGDKSSTAMSFSSVETSSDAAYSIMAKFDSTYWTGDVTKVKLSMTDKDVTGQQVVWSASATIGAVNISDRKIFISDAKGNLVPFTKDNVISSSGEYIVDATNLMGTRFPRLYMGLNEAFNLSTCAASERADFIEAYVNYVRGDHSYEVASDAISSDPNALNKCGVVGFRERNNGVLGAIITSTPQVITRPSGKVVVFAANDGMVHFLNEANGKELFAIIPYVAQYGMASYAKKDTNSRYVLDGEIKIATLNVGSSSRTIAIGSTGMTNPGMYAFDLTNMSTDVSSISVLWELTKSEEQGVIHHVNALGSFNEPVNVFAHTVKQSNGSKVTKAYAVFGNGYNSNVPDKFVPYGDNVEQIDYGTVAASNGESGLIVLNAFTGKVLSLNSNTKGMVNNSIWSTANCKRFGNTAPSSSNTMYLSFYNTDSAKCYANGMNSSVAAYDSDHDGSPDFVYSTDLYGNVYRTTMSTEPVSNWVMNKIHTTVRADGSSNPYVEPITTKPSIAAGVSGKPFIVVGTGQYLTVADIKNSDLQSIWGLDDKGFDSNTKIICSTIDELPTCRTSNNLYRMTMANYVGSTEATKNFRNIVLPTSTDGSGPVSYDSDQFNGWVIDMTATYGERVVVSPTVVEKHAYVTTMIPTDDPCSGGGVGHMYDLNILSGTFYSSPEESQLYSDQIMSKSTLTYSKGQTEAESQAEATATDPAPRKRRSNSYGCAAVSNWTQINGGEAKKMVGPQYCPRVESWQYIFN